MNVYDVAHVNGDTYEVEADFYECRGPDYVFYSGIDEVLRLPLTDVMSVLKSPSHPRSDRNAAEQLWL